MAATIDHVSGGRLELGIGAGWWQMEHDEYGIPFHTPARRIRMVGETAKILRSLWTEHRTTFEGRYYQLKDALAEPKPVQRPLPLWVGGMGEQLTLRVVAESADGWNGFLGAIDQYRHKLDVLAEHCRAVGRDPNEIRKSLVLQALIGRDEAEVRERAERVARARNTTVEALRQQAVVGTPEEVAAQLVPYARLGVGDFLLGARPPYDYPLFELFVERVAPLVRHALAAPG
jgi:alkanesulfonate monooxygenase SsuD/methylene tetrahydromethanopterin reductase-like flavin-dependent oxidoreductase (luciferase family)